MNSINKSLDNAVSKAARFGKMFGIAIAGGIALGTREALGFEKKMREVSTMLGENVDIMGTFDKQLKAMAIDTGKAPLELAEGLRQVLSAGIPAAEAMEFLNIANKGAIAGVAQTVEAVDLLTGVVNAYGLEASEAGRIGDIVFQSIKDGKTTYEELAASMGEVLPFAAQLGVSLEDLFAATTTMTKGSIKQVNATTFLKNVFAQVISASDTQKKAAANLGIAFDGSSIKAMGFAKWIDQIRVKTGGSNEALSKLFPSIRAITAVLALAGKQNKEFTRIQQNNINSTGAQAEAFRRMEEGPAAAVERTLNAIKVAGIDISQKVIPQLGKAIDALGGAAGVADTITSAFTDMIDGFKIMINTLNDILNHPVMKLSNALSISGVLGSFYNPQANVVEAQKVGAARHSESQQGSDPRFKEGTGSFDARQKALTTSNDLMEAFGFAVDKTLNNVKHNVAVELKKRQGAEAVASGL
jgi:TP901 family phage tail tape measure protein